MKTLSKMKKRGFTLVELMIVVAIIGILAAIAIPNFIRFQARSKQGEAKTNLKALFTAQKSFYAEKDRYSTDGSEVGFAKTYLQGLGVTTIDYHFCSHYHSDHLGCIDDLAAIGITIGTTGYDRGSTYSSGTYTA